MAVETFCGPTAADRQKPMVIKGTATGCGSQIMKSRRLSPSSCSRRGRGMSRRETGEGKRAVAQYESFLQLAKRLLHPTQVSPSARTIEIFGYVMLAEGTTIFVATRSVAALLGLP